MFLYAVHPLFADIHKIGVWSGDPETLRAHHHFFYGHHDTMYIYAADNKKTLHREKRRLRDHLAMNGLWRCGDIFDYSPALVAAYCNEHNFQVAHGTHRCE